MATIGEILHGGPVDESEMRRVRDVLLFEEPGLKVRLVRFWALLVLASAIATYGLIGDSVATVIGAMIVAPLMLPIMGLAFSISIGDRKAVWSSLVVGLGGMLTAIAVGYVLALPFARTLNPENVSQIMARTSPKLVDLLAALATGLAGAFAIGRKDVSDTLPGVAIAISLVPPLANAGILFAVNRPDLAVGSVLLFVTNYLAILLTGTFVFALMAYPRVAMAGRAPASRRGAVVLIVVLVVAVMVPLAATSYQVSVQSVAQQRAQDAATAWVKGTGYRFVSASAENPVRVVIAGDGSVPSTAALQTALKGQLFGMPVVVEAVREQRTAFPTK